jgi:hypothetical protein
MPFEMGNTMFNIVNIYTRAAQYGALPAESRFRLPKTGSQILSMIRHRQKRYGLKAGSL